MTVSVPNCVSGNPFYAKYTRRVFEGFAGLVFRYYCPIEVHGLANLPNTSFILCSNHASHMDSIALMAASSRRFDRFGLLAASDYFFRNPVVYRSFSALVNLIPISRTPTPASLHQTLSLCRGFVKNGERYLIVFPEGTRSRNGSIGNFKPGIGLLSVKLGLPVVPAYIHGTREAMPIGRFFPRHKPVAVRIGSPIYPPAESHGTRRHDWMVEQARLRIDELRAGAASPQEEQTRGR